MVKRKEVREKVGEPGSAPGAPHLGQRGVHHQLHTWGLPNRGWESAGGRKVIFQGYLRGQTAGRAGHPHAVLQGSTGLIPGVFKAQPGHIKPECEAWGRNGSAPRNKAERISVPETNFKKGMKSAKEDAGGERRRCAGL